MSAARTRPRPLTLTADERRDLTVRRVTSVFADRGFVGATMAELARAGGVSQALLYKLFGSKRGLYEAMVADKLRRMQDGVVEVRLPEPANDLGFFLLVANTLLDRAAEDPDFFRLLMFSDLEGGELSELWYGIRGRRVVAHIRAYIEKRIADGAFIAVDAESVARSFLAMIWQQALVRYVFRSQPVEPIDRETQVDTTVRVYVRGLLAAPEALDLPAPAGGDETDATDA